MTNQDKNLTIRINSELLKEYKEFCDKNGHCLSKRIKNFIKKELLKK